MNLRLAFRWGNITATPPVECYQIVTNSAQHLHYTENDSSRKSFDCGYFC